MKNEITYRPRALAAVFAIGFTALILNSVDSVARMTVAHERALAAASAQPVAAAVQPVATAVQPVAAATGRIERIVVIAKRLPLPQLTQQVTMR